MDTYIPWLETDYNSTNIDPCDYNPAFNTVRWVGLSKLKRVLQHPKHSPKSTPVSSMKDFAHPIVT